MRNYIEENYGEIIEALDKVYGVDVPQSNSFEFYDVEEVIDFRNDLQNSDVINEDVLFDLTDCIVDDHYLDEMVKYEVESGGGWLRVSYLLQEADRTADYHYINGYGNIERLSSDRLENILIDILENIEIEAE